MAKRTYESDAGPSQRQLRVGEVVRRALSDALMRGETHEPELDGVSITVTEVRCSPDLKIATAYVMPLGGANGEAMEEVHERLVVATGVVLDESLECRVALLPGRRPEAEQRLEVVEADQHLTPRG